LAHHHFPILLYDQMVVGDPTHRLQYGYLLPTGDGQVYLRTVETPQWDRLAAWMGNPDWAQRRDANELPIYYSAPEIVGPLLSEWTIQFTSQELLAGALERRIPIAASRELEDVLAWDHLQMTGAWSSADDGDTRVRLPRIPLVERSPLRASAADDVDDVERRWLAR
jgi:crotonobetainyl-CoA:carnitine CoA-transferase CaiB-like acyl-CoA transferase